MIRICHLTSVHNVEDDRIYVRECFSLAKNQNYEVMICGPGKDKEMPGVRVVGCGEKEKSTRKRLLKYDRGLIQKALRLDADVYHIHDPELLLHAKKLKKNKAIVIFDSHEDYPEQIKNKEYIPLILRYLISSIYKAYETHVCRIIDGVIFPCLVDGEDIFAGRAKKHALINNVPVVKEIPEKQINRTKLGEYVCCAGGLTKDRGIEQLIDACYLADIKLVLAGAFDDEEFEKRLRNKPSFSVVDYKGICSREEIMEIYKNAGLGASTIQNVGQYPKIWNLPTKVYEFMMYELPFVISDFDYCKKIIDENKCGIVVDPSDSYRIAKGIKQIIENPEESLEMGKNGRKAIDSVFNWNIEEKELLCLYEELLKEKNI